MPFEEAADTYLKIARFSGDPAGPGAVPRTVAPGPSAVKMSNAATVREIIQLPANRPTFKLLIRSTLAMAIIPISVYFLCFNILFGEKGPLCVWDLSKDLNSRANFSGFAAIAAVQVCCWKYIISVITVRDNFYDRSSLQHMSMKRFAKMPKNLKRPRKSELVNLSRMIC